MNAAKFPYWIEGEVDRSREHAEVWWGDGKHPVALVGAPMAEGYVVEFLLLPEGERDALALEVVRQSLTCELGRCTPTDPWGHIRQCCQENGSGFAGPMRWAWSQGHSAKASDAGAAVPTYGYADLIRAFADWLPYRDAKDSGEKRYFENRWRAFSKAFGISLALDQPGTVPLRKNVECPAVYFHLIERASRSYGQAFGQSHDCFSGVLEAPKAFGRLHQRYALRIQRADSHRLNAEDKLKRILLATCCDTVKLLYGRQKRPVTFTDLEACGINAVPRPVSMQSDGD